jgi:hypothetical protein
LRTIRARSPRLIRVPVRIRQNFLATKKDGATLRAGVRLVREIGVQTPLASFTT